MAIINRLKSLGPGILVTSAFIGPGTITVCSIAGYQFGYQLLWALIFSVVATIILQEMCARLGIITRSGLGTALNNTIRSPLLKVFIMFLIFSAIIVGNSAYEAGNISGATLGISTILGEKYTSIISLSIGFLALVIILSGSYKIIERFMIVLVVTMSIVFIVTALYLKPDLKKILEGSFIPSFPEGSGLLIVGLIGTTIVPYNLFLHASSTATKWQGAEHLPEARFDTIISIIIGGIISMAIIITAGSVSGIGSISGGADLAVQLEPLLGNWARYFIAAGLFAAGISSSITAPLAAAYAASGIFNFPSVIGNPKFRLVSGGILLTGIIFSVAGFKPVEIIQFAQFANGALLPLIALFLVWVMNKKDLLGNFTNNPIQNFLGILVIIVTLILGIKSILAVTGIF